MLESEFLHHFGHQSTDCLDPWFFGMKSLFITGNYGDPRIFEWSVTVWLVVNFFDIPFGSPVNVMALWNSTLLHKVMRSQIW